MDEQQNNLEEKLGFFGRMKYAAIPALLTAGAYFAPEIKKKYSSLSEDKKMKYQNTLLWGLEVAGTVTAVVSGAKLYRNYKSGNSSGRENM